MEFKYIHSMLPCLFSRCVLQNITMIALFQLKLKNKKNLKEKSRYRLPVQKERLSFFPAGEVLNFNGE